MSWSKILPFRKRARPVETPDEHAVFEAFPRFRAEWTRPVVLVRGKVSGFGIPPHVTA